MIASNGPLLQAINDFPIVLDPVRLEERGGIEDTLRKNSANIIKPVDACSITPNLNEQE